MTTTPDRIRTATTSLGRLLPLLLHGHVHATTTGTVGRITGSVARPLPGGTDAMDLAHEVTETLGYWAHVVVDARLSVGCDLADDHATLHLLDVHADRLADHDQAEAATCADELADLVRRVRGSVDRRPDKVFVGPCTEVVDGEPCLRDLRGHDGAGTATCSAGHVVDAATQRATALAEAHWQVLPLQQVADLSERLWGRPVTLRTLKRWREQRRLTTTNLSVEGAVVSCARVSDVARLVETSAA